MMLHNALSRKHPVCHGISVSGTETHIIIDNLKNNASSVTENDKLSIDASINLALKESVIVENR